MSPEPSEEREVEYLRQRFGRDATIHHYFARTVRQRQRLPEKPELRGYLARYLERIARAAGWPDYDLSLDHLITMHDEIHDHAFDPEQCHCFEEDLNSGINPVSWESLCFRDEHIVGEIVRLWTLGKSLFVVYGSAHALRQEPALERLLPASRFATAGIKRVASSRRARPPPSGRAGHWIPP
jgi:hypothetical protein